MYGSFMVKKSRYAVAVRKASEGSIYVAGTGPLGGFLRNWRSFVHRVIISNINPWRAVALNAWNYYSKQQLDQINED